MNNFLLISKYQVLLDQFKDSLNNKYNVKDFKEVKITISQQVTWNQNIKTLKIDQSAFIQNLYKKKNPINGNTINILMKAENFIKMIKDNDYKKTDLKI